MADEGASPAPASGLGNPSSEFSGSWGVEPVDLSDDWALKDCPRITFRGKSYPSLGGVALAARIGKGGMGVVFYGVHTRVFSEVAVKVLPRDLVMRHKNLLKRFLREARLAARLKSPYLVHVTDVNRDESSGNYYIVMEFVKGLSAAEWRRKMTPDTDEIECLDICIATARGLAVAHDDDIIHRDIKPANVLLPYDRKGVLRPEMSKLADLGLAHHDDNEQSLTGTALTLGTPGYLAPEQALDAKRASKPADVFGVGATLYALLVGRAPFSGKSASDALVRTALGRYKAAREARADITKHTAALIEKCLRPKPSQRYADANELLEALIACRARVVSERGGAAPAKPVEPPPEPASKPAADSDVEPMGEPVYGWDDDGSGPPHADDPSAKPGMHIVSDPPGAVVIVDGVRRGMSPLLVPGLAEGAHEVRLEFDGCETWITNDAKSVLGKRTVVRAMLHRLPSTLVIRAAPGALVRLDRQDAPAISYEFELDRDGRLPATEIEAGTYDLTIEAAGYSVHEEVVQAAARGLCELRAEMHAKGAAISVFSEPTDAELLVDGVAVGRTPVKGHALEPGRHTLRLQKAGHQPLEKDVELTPGQALDLGTLELVGQSTLDLSQAGHDVIARLRGRVMQHGDVVDPGPVELRLERRGYAPQVLNLTARPAEAVLVVPAPWDGRQAKLDLGNLPEGVTATIDGVPVFGVVNFDRQREVTIELNRPDHEPQHYTTEVVLGKVQGLSEVADDWRKLPGKLDFSHLDEDVIVQVHRKNIENLEDVASGPQDVRLVRPGYVGQTVSVNVRAKEENTIRANTWKRPLLPDQGSWDRLPEDALLQAIEPFTKRMWGFTFRATERFECGDESRLVPIFVHQKTGLEFALVPAGTFLMGSPPTESEREEGETLHDVTLSLPFLVCRTPVTQSAWISVMRANPAMFKGDENPVERISWNEAREFCFRTELSLPTEAQWEYACRAGTRSRFCFGDDESLIDDYAWHNGIAENKSHPVAQKKPNGFGLYDVHGNVWEWCEDSYGPYGRGGGTDPLGDTGQTARVLRGGAWNFAPKYARCAFRRKSDPNKRFVSLGFRPVSVVTLG